MRVLLISNSARGEAIADAFVRSPQKPDVFALSTVRSPGLLRMCREVQVMDIMSFSAIVAKAREVQPEFAFIAPDDPIGAGLADRLESIGIPCVAPKKSLARIESSKSFARNLLQAHDVNGSPGFKVFSLTSAEEKIDTELAIRSYIERELHGQYVVKYDALRGGKGVKVSGEHLASIDDGARYAMECLELCGTVVIEEKLVGVEFSLMSFVSGEAVVDMPAVQDHKRANIGDTGPNTGGMGTYSDANHSLPFLLPEELSQASAFNRRVASALMKECGEPYKGILYGGFIATRSGVKIIEYNARFGDPEALNVLPLLRSDFVEICRAIVKGYLTSDLVTFQPKASVCKYITPQSYPDDKKERGQRVLVPGDISENTLVFYGDVTQDPAGNALLGGSRSIGIVGVGKSIAEAETECQELCERCIGPVRFRPDIGTAEMIEKKVELMRSLRADCTQ